MDDASGQDTKLNRILHWVGGALGLAGTLFVLLRLHEYAGQIDLGRFGVGAWGVLAGLAVVYGAANVLLGLAWWHLLCHFGAKESLTWAVRAFGLSQVAKYVPGNIFHLAGRQALGLAAGLPGWALAKSAIWEIGLLSLSGCLFGVLATPLFFTVMSTPLALIAFLATFVALVGLTRLTLSPSVAFALVWYGMFLSVSGWVFVGALLLVVPAGIVSTGDLLALSGAYVVAWLAGLLTPGAPAGVGVRELLLLFLLNGLVAEAELLVAVLLGRVVTVAGDFLFLLFAYHMNERTLAREEFRRP